MCDFVDGGNDNIFCIVDACVSGIFPIIQTLFSNALQTVFSLRKFYAEQIF